MRSQHQRLQPFSPTGEDPAPPPLLPAVPAVCACAAVSLAAAAPALAVGASLVGDDPEPPTAGQQPSWGWNSMWMPSDVCVDNHSVGVHCMGAQ